MARRGGCGGLIRPTPALFASERRRRDKPFGRPLRIPAGAQPWHSDYLMPDESYSITLTLPGVYDFYCIPHEHAGMVGRIVVGRDTLLEPSRDTGQGETMLPEVALRTFPSVEQIVSQGFVFRK